MTGTIGASDSDPRGISPECDDDICITCSDQGTAVRLVELLGDGLALVDTGSTIEQVSVALVDATVGDRLLVHAKEAIAVMEGG
ncbi:MAG TPA: HypC/HybG/HupF family hydrogenase formation chaperone [Acidimicrobiales bacterium]|jgi:hydrogenase expression/formation protein HypC